MRKLRRLDTVITGVNKINTEKDAWLEVGDARAFLNWQVYGLRHTGDAPCSSTYVDEWSTIPQCFMRAHLMPSRDQHIQHMRIQVGQRCVNASASEIV